MSNVDGIYLRRNWGGEFENVQFTFTGMCKSTKKVGDGIEETLAYCDFPSEHWTRIRTNNVIERLNR